MPGETCLSHEQEGMGKIRTNESLPLSRRRGKGNIPFLAQRLP
jgi:hypothetical protein